ncbi:GreA/GreB family elongation factor [Amycolatopsis magusensis]|uniref:GreA/GreB family elongation factor n=1 Tax=Amycolatopsis magusensis TaxID=882444 RepID=UPI0037BA5086
MPSTGSEQGGTQLSPAARERLEGELARLREQRAVNAPNFRDEDPIGDSADQADLIERAETTAFIDRRIREVTDLLTHGKSQTAAAKEGLLPGGTEVTLRFADGDEETMQVVEFADEATTPDASALTSDSPLGRALVGHQSGDTITYRTPGGDLSAEIVSLKLPA